MYNTGNPIGSTAPKDFSDNSEITDRYVNDVVNETTLDRFGRSRLTIYGQQEKARRSFEQFESDAANVIANLGFFPPVDYTTGLNVDSRNFTVTYNSVVYAAQPSAVPFTTGAWDAAQWYPIQNLLNQKNLLVFDTYAEASAAAATLPDGQNIESPDSDGNLRKYIVENGTLKHVGYGYSDVSGSISAALPSLVNNNSSPVPGVPVYPAAAYSDNEFLDLTDSFGDGLYRHSPRMARSADGVYHLVYSRGKMHGYGGLLEANEVNPEGEAIYRTSRDLVNWSEEQVICSALPPDAGLNQFRTVFDCIIGITPTGRVVIAVSDIPPPSQQWGRPTGNTKYRLFVNDKNGSSDAWVDRGVFFEADGDYARLYCNGIKRIPAPGGGWRMAMCDYRRLSPSVVGVGMFYSDDNFDTLPVRGADIFQNAGNTETDFAFLDSRVGVAVSRTDFATAITENGGQTWTQIGTRTSFDRTIVTDLIAPIIEIVESDGVKHIVVGFSERSTSPRMIRWTCSTLSELKKFQAAVAASTQYTPWSSVTQSGIAFTGSAGYHGAVMSESGDCVYVDVTETTSDPATGFMRAQLRAVRFSLGTILPMYHGIMLGSKKSRLKQYNEGDNVFSPTLIGSSTTGTYTTASAVGFNTRIGNVCHFHAYVALTAITGFSGALRIDGLPYQSVNGISQHVKIEVASVMGAGWNYDNIVVGVIASDSKNITLYRKVGASNALTALTPAELGAVLTAHISGSYFCRYVGDQ